MGTCCQSQVKSQFKLTLPFISELLLIQYVEVYLILCIELHKLVLRSIINVPYRPNQFGQVAKGQGKKLGQLMQT